MVQKLRSIEGVRFETPRTTVVNLRVRAEAITLRVDHVGLGLTPVGLGLRCLGLRHLRSGLKVLGLWLKVYTPTNIIIKVIEIEDTI